jgi:hypothetical protein
MTSRRWFAVLAGAAVAVTGAQSAYGDTKNNPARFSTLESASAETARAQARAWLRTAVNNDAAKMQAFDAIWADSARTITERVGDTFALGHAGAARLLRDARDAATPAPTEIPSLFKDEKLSPFFRANLALAYSRILSNRRVHEEALATLRLFKAEQVVDPSGFLFHQAVCEHALLSKQDAGKTIGRLLQDALDSPERYKTVGMLMLLDMQTWKDKDLGAVARKMDNIQRRLDLARGGPETQKLQKEVIARLDELIKELENKAQNKQPGEGGGSGPPQPGSGPPSGNNPSAPATESGLVPGNGTGRVDPVVLRRMAEGWGKMNERERAQALQQVEDLTRGLSLAHQEAIRDYFRRLAEDSTRRQSSR